MKDNTKTWVFTGKQFEDFRRRKKYTSTANQLTAWNARTLNTRKKFGPCEQEDIN